MYPGPARSRSWQLSYGSGTVERFGPKMVPLRGRGFTETDVRIHAIDPLDRSFWPFTEKPLEISDDDRPPSPGEEAKPFDDMQHIGDSQLKASRSRGSVRHRCRS